MFSRRAWDTEQAQTSLPQPQGPQHSCVPSLRAKESPSPDILSSKAEKAILKIKPCKFAKGGNGFGSIKADGEKTSFQVTKKGSYNSTRKEVNDSECPFKMGQSHGFKLVGRETQDKHMETPAQVIRDGWTLEETVMGEMVVYPC